MQINDSDNQIIENNNQLKNYFLSGYKPKEEFKVGCEYEKFAIFTPELKSLDYYGDKGIYSLFKGLEKNYNWEPEYEGENIISLFKNSSSVTLEPGGQVELSGKPHKTLHEVYDEIQEHILELKDITKNWGISWYASGLNPFMENEDIPWMPKERYKIMKKYLITKGELSHYMMKQTATVQANFDYIDEEDAIKKFRISYGVNAIVIAMFANSPIYNGKETGFYTKRSDIWKYTDPERCGIPKNVFSPNYTYEDYMNFVLNNRMFLIKRNGQTIDMTHITFKEFMKNGYKDYRATHADWLTQLTTVFPEIRLMRYVELRGTDSQNMDLVMAIPALWKGILYNKDALDAAWELVKNFDYETHKQWRLDVARYAMQAKIKNYKTKELAKELFKIAYESLKKENFLNDKKQNETIYLEELEEKVIKIGKSPAETLIENWETKYNKELDKLIKVYKI